MKIAVLAASGKAGSLITKEALARGHEVSAFVGDAKKLILQETHLSIIQKDIFALDSRDLQGFYAVIDAFREAKEMSLFRAHIQHLSAILTQSEASHCRGWSRKYVYKQCAHNATA